MNRSTEMQKTEAIRALQRNWLAEKESARIYRELGESERDPKRKGVLMRLAEAEERHAEKWKSKLREFGGELPGWSDSAAKRFNRWVNRRLGAAVAIRRLEAAEDRDKARYEEQQKKALGQDADAQRILDEIAHEEKAHGMVLQNLGPSLGPKTTLDVMLKRERWHRQGVSWVATDSAVAIKREG